MKKKNDDVMKVPEKELTYDGFERPVSSKDDPFWFFRFDWQEEKKDVN